jgi:hypothetical protein
MGGIKIGLVGAGEGGGGGGRAGGLGGEAIREGVGLAAVHRANHSDRGSWEELGFAWACCYHQATHQALIVGYWKRAACISAKSEDHNAFTDEELDGAYAIADTVHCPITTAFQSLFSTLTQHMGTQGRFGTRYQYLLGTLVQIPDLSARRAFSSNRADDINPTSMAVGDSMWSRNGWMELPSSLTAMPFTT